MPNFEVSVRLGPKRLVQAANSQQAIAAFKELTGIISSDHPFQAVPVQQTVTPVDAGPPVEVHVNPEATQEQKPAMRLHEYAKSKGLENSVVVGAAVDMQFDSSHPNSGLTATEIEMLDEYLAKAS